MRTFPSYQVIRYARIALAVFFVVGGSAHFVMPGFYRPMMPPWLPAHSALIAISGVFEILGGMGVLVPRSRRFAAWGLIALLVAVFPANLHVAFDADAAKAFGWPQWLMIARLPAQVVFICWVYFACLMRTEESSRTVETKA